MMAAMNFSDQMRISDLLYGLTAIIDNTQGVSGISLDSRNVKPGDIFLACHGTSTDGSKFINEAIRAGAVAVAIESDRQDEPATIKVPVYKINNLRQQAGLIAARFYGFPSHELCVIGVTGTNGKTSVTYYIAQALEELEKSCGLVGTIGYGVIDKLKSGGTTTPDPITLQQLFSQWRTDQITHVALEVSSHALDQGRVSGVEFDVAVFTNLSRDHLDYHETMSRYADAKRLLFDNSTLKYAVINMDDGFGKELAATTRAVNKVGYSLNNKSDCLSDVEIPIVFGNLKMVDGLRSIIDIDSPWGCGQLEMQMVSQFNAANLLACLSVLCVLEIPFNTAIESLSKCGGIPGRMECFGGDSVPLLVVDYAHTPDALKQILLSLRPVCRGNLICVFGCGGERDKGKRPVMGKIAEDYADYVVLTNDNPRGEDPDVIINDILTGISNHSNVRVVTDRITAITHAIRNADQQDIVIIAGKGHETHQEIAGKFYPFSDRELVRRLAEEN
jgi:UDP-N-acetylmuramoyl-L-alanyl-D-glutamate--2,6-diaminopimelate ligase